MFVIRLAIQFYRYVRCETFHTKFTPRYENLERARLNIVDHFVCNKCGRRRETYKGD